MPPRKRPSLRRHAVPRLQLVPDLSVLPSPASASASPGPESSLGKGMITCTYHTPGVTCRPSSLSGHQWYLLRTVSPPGPYQEHRRHPTFRPASTETAGFRGPGVNGDPFGDKCSRHLVLVPTWQAMLRGAGLVFDYNSTVARFAIPLPPLPPRTCTGHATHRPESRDRLPCNPTDRPMLLRRR